MKGLAWGGLGILAVTGCVGGPRLGRPVSGGTEMTYRLEPSSLSNYLKSHPESSREDVTAQVVRVMEARVKNLLGLTSGTVLVKGDLIVIDLPGYSDAQTARQFMGSTGRLVVYHAKSVSTSKSERLYVPVKSDLDSKGVPTVNFLRGSNAINFNEDPTNRSKYQSMIDSWTPILGNSEIMDAFVQVSGSRYQPSFTFSSVGADKLTKFSKRYASQGENLAFVLDGRVLQLAPLQDGAILSDTAFVDGDFDPAYAKALTEMVKLGALPVDLREEDIQVVGPASVAR